MDREYWQFVEEDSYRGGTEVKMCRRSVLDPRGEIAVAFIEKWGMVAAIDDGEDSAGRHRVRLATVPEIVGRAIEASAALYEVFEQKGWVITVPAIKPAELAKK